MDTVTKQTEQIYRKEVINLYSKQDKLVNFKTLKGKLPSSKYLQLKPYCWLHCLCFISLVFLNYIIYILNSKLDWLEKVKSWAKVINVIKEVKEIEVFVNKQKIETIQVYNDELQESWKLIKYY